MTSLTAFGLVLSGGRGGRLEVVAASSVNGQDEVPVSEALRRLAEDPGFWTPVTSHPFPRCWVR